MKTMFYCVVYKQQVKYYAIQNVTGSSHWLRGGACMGVPRFERGGACLG